MAKQTANSVSPSAVNKLVTAADSLNTHAVKLQTKLQAGGSISAADMKALHKRVDAVTASRDFVASW